MTKTPVTILQEVTIKCGTLPTYTEISSNKINHENRFTVGVKWKSYNATGVGGSKMEAKHNAAREMLSLLLSSGAISRSLVSLVLNNGLATINIMPTNSVTSTATSTSTSIVNSLNYSDNSLISSPSSSASAPNLKNTFTNYVGLLNEYCISRHIPEPHYDIVNIAGPPHCSVFTMSCKAASVCEEASATTKRNAKHEVAKKVLQRLTVDTDFNAKHDTLETFIEKLNVEYMNLKICEPKIDDSKTEKVLTTYRQLKHKDPVSKNQLQIDSYHQILSSLCYNIPQIEKNSLISICERQTYCTQNISYLKNHICSVLHTTAQTITFKANIEDRFIIGLRLSTFPTILEIGIGETTEQAEMQALYKLLRLIFVLLK